MVKQLLRIPLSTYVFIPFTVADKRSCGTFPPGLDRVDVRLEPREQLGRTVSLGHMPQEPARVDSDALAHQGLLMDALTRRRILGSVEPVTDRPARERPSRHQSDLHEPLDLRTHRGRESPGHVPRKRVRAHGGARQVGEPGAEVAPARQRRLVQLEVLRVRANQEDVEAEAHADDPAIVRGVEVAALLPQRGGGEGVIVSGVDRGVGVKGDDRQGLVVQSQGHLARLGAGAQNARGVPQLLAREHDPLVLGQRDDAVFVVLQDCLLPNHELELRGELVEARGGCDNVSHGGNESQEQIGGCGSKDEYGIRTAQYSLASR